MRILIACLLLSACGRSPKEAAQLALSAVEARSSADLLKAVDPAYADALGGRDQLVADVESLWDRYGRIEIETDEVSTQQGASELDADVVGLLDADFVGAPTWKVRGTFVLEVTRNTDGFRVRSGLLTNFRDLERLMRIRREALEANDAAKMKDALHPNYRDGDLDLDGAIARLSRDLEGRKVRIEATNYRVDLRGAQTHVDEHYRLIIDDRPTPPSVGRFTMERSAGRLRIAAGLYPKTR